MNENEQKLKWKFLRCSNIKEFLLPPVLVIFIEIFHFFKRGNYERTNGNFYWILTIFTNCVVQTKISSNNAHHRAHLKFKNSI